MGASVKIHLMHSDEHLLGFKCNMTLQFHDCTSHKVEFVYYCLLLLSVCNLPSDDQSIFYCAVDQQMCSCKIKLCSCKTRFVQL